MTRTEDLFEARLKHIQNKPGAPRNYQKLKARHDHGRRSQYPAEHSYLLPALATACLIVGATAFSTIMFLPELPSGHFVTSDAQVIYAPQTVTE